MRHNSMNYSLADMKHASEFPLSEFASFVFLSNHICRLVCEFGMRMVSAAQRFVDAYIVSMLAIPAMSHPFKIGQFIVSFISIYVIALIAEIGRLQKGQRHQSVNLATNIISIIDNESDLKITSTIIRRLHEIWRLRSSFLCSDDTLYLATRANFIAPSSVNWEPSFYCCHLAIISSDGA